MFAIQGISMPGFGATVGSQFHKKEDNKENFHLCTY